jgi:biopolymer transport protein ExbB
MFFLEAPFIAIRSFFEAGGNVLWGIFAVTMLMWSLIIERVWFFRSVLPVEVQKRKAEWDARSDRRSWRAQRIRELLISEIKTEARRYLKIIQVLMVLLPLLGLLGTVTGMIQVFNVMAIAGTSNARLMAGGVSAATIPTMAGLVAALSGYYFAGWLQRKAEDEIKQVADLLVSE